MPAYGLRSAVTRRASRTSVLVPARRRQDASNRGQACSEQSRPIGRKSSRSLFASGWGTLASTVGAKPGRMVRAAAAHAASEIAESALIMTVPCDFIFSGFFALDLVDQLVTKSGFRMLSLKPENGFVRGVICFVAPGPTKQRLQDRATGCGNWQPCGGARGALVVQL